MTSDPTVQGGSGRGQRHRAADVVAEQIGPDGSAPTDELTASREATMIELFLPADRSAAEDFGVLTLDEINQRVTRAWEERTDRLFGPVIGPIDGDYVERSGWLIFVAGPQYGQKEGVTPLSPVLVDELVERVGTVARVAHPTDQDATLLLWGNKFAEIVGAPYSEELWNALRDKGYVDAGTLGIQSAIPPHAELSSTLEVIDALTVAPVTRRDGLF